MGKRAKLRLVAILLVSFLAAGLFGLRHGHSEPKYQGSSLVQWVERESSDATPQQVEQSYAAICTIASNNIPLLVVWLAYDPNPRKTQLDSALSWMPFSIKWTLEQGPMSDDKEAHAHAATIALAMLGPAAAPAIPQLARLFNSTSRQVAYRALYVTSQVGAQGVAVLLPLATNENYPLRRQVLALLGQIRDLGTNASIVAATLARSTQSNDPNIVRTAAQGLAHLPLEPSTSVPALVAALINTNVDTITRAALVHALAQFGQAADAALPQIVQCLEDPSPGLRRDATNALRKIAPELFTNAPSP